MNIIRDFAAHIVDTIEELNDYTTYSLEINDNWSYTLYNNCQNELIPKVVNILGTEPLDYELMVDKVEEHINNQFEDNIDFNGEVVEGYYL